ncbi:MAG TPA: hypothetical protein VHU60_02885 [Gaiellaceae bacterium]|nr:hypothetical protein [Gaiellaceae bacterium]
MQQPELEAGLSSGQLEARQCVDGGHVGTQPADVARKLLHRETRPSGGRKLIAASDEFALAARLSRLKER